MKIGLLLLVAFVSTLALKYNGKIPRQYYPEENNRNRLKYLIYIDKHRTIHIEDLTLPPLREPTVDDVQLYLYTHKNQDDGVLIDIRNLDDLINASVYDHRKENYFIVHGWLNHLNSSVITLLREAILAKTDSNVFVVDWSKIANTDLLLSDYVTARNAVPTIGLYLGTFINKMVQHYNVSPKMFKLIGFSLGAHVAGCAGAKVNGLVKYITGLDPASPTFTLDNIDDRLDPTDAEFVHIVHTSRLGFHTSIGHADYFPNGGTTQPACKKIDAIFDIVGMVDIIDKLLELLKIILETFGILVSAPCSHERSYLYYAESIWTNGFKSQRCLNYEDYMDGKCKNNPLSNIGSLDLDTSAKGDYFLITNDKPPYSMD